MDAGPGKITGDGPELTFLVLGSWVFFLSFCLPPLTSFNDREERKWGDGGSYFYFPEAGELRLERPPCVRGGIVAEEMVSIYCVAACSPAA